MRTRVSLVLPLATLMAAAFGTGCSHPYDSGDTDPTVSENTSSKPSSKDKTILTSAEAQAAFEFVRSASDRIETAVPMNFSAPYTVTGAAGSVSVRGTKTRTTSSSSSSSSSTQTSNLSLEFTGYGTSSSNTTSGSATYYEYHYSRTACSSSTCASAYDDTESLKGTAISVKFQYGGATYSDRITVDGYSGKDTSFWDVTVTNQAGARFTFTHR